LKNKPIGIFDSGVGGLTVARQIMDALPQEHLIYFGDSLRAPYGDRAPEQLAQFSRQIIDFLMDKDIKALVVACGTISARIFGTVEQMTDIPVLGMVVPGVTAALAATKTGRIGVMATAGTVASGAHRTAILTQRPDAQVMSVACPLFVPLTEEGWSDNTVADMTAQIYLADMAANRIDTAILGCTHYPLLINSIKKALPSDVTIVDPAVVLAQDLKKTLGDAGLTRVDDTLPVHQFYISGNKEKFDKISALALKVSCDAQVVKLYGNK